MSKSDLSKMMQERSPLVNRESVEPADLYVKQNIPPISPVQQESEPSYNDNGDSAGYSDAMTMQRQMIEMQRTMNFLMTAVKESARIERQPLMKYTTHLPVDTVKKIKRFALERDLRDYQVMQKAIEEYLVRHPIE